ncbi:MAG: stress response translation initiation inhibitor YciH [Candidatus Aenigmatarchaeota archaeon]
MPELCKCGAKLTGNMCSTCGLPADLCACMTIDREAQKIRVFIEHRKFNKPVTIIEGITENTKSVASQIKTKLACGGTIKKNHIELQGDHSVRLKDILIKLGYSVDQIEIS